MTAHALPWRLTSPTGVALQPSPTLETALPEASFRFLADLLYRESGLAIGPEKAYLVHARLGALASEWGVKSLHELVGVLRTEAALPPRGARPVTLAVCDALTTNETLFFRDGHPFLALRDVVLPAAAERRRLAAGRGTPSPVRIWCAAASTGQEPYSAAMCAALAGPRMRGVPVEIVATDYSPRVLKRAREGIYSEFEARRGLAADHIARFFVPVAGGLQVSAALRDGVRFERRNLLEPFTDLGRFDVVLCRNVLLYFDPATKARVLDRVADTLLPDGLLFLGSAESAAGTTRRLRRSPRTTSIAFERTDA